MSDMITLSERDNRILRKTKIQSIGSDRWTYGFVVLDTGARYSFIGIGIYKKLRLPNLGGFKFLHSDGDTEKGIYTTMIINIKGEKFPINVIVSEKISEHDVIVGADFMQYYQSYLLFNVSKNTVSLKPIKKKRSIWRDM